MPSRSEYLANRALQPIDPSSWTRPAPVRCRVANPSPWERIRGALPGVLGALVLAASVFLPVALHWA